MSDQKREKAIENYWLSKLSGKLPGVFLPFADHDKAGKKGYEKGVSNVPISPALTAELHELVDHSGIALFIFFLAGLNILLYKYSGIDDLVVGTASPRKEESKDNLLFCRHKMHGDPTPKEVVMELKQMVIEAFNYSDYSFADLYGKLLTMSSETALNIFNVAFIYDKIQNHPRSLNQFELVFILSQEEKGMTLQAEYNASLYDRRIIDRFMQNWVHFFNLFIEKANRPISGIDILSPGEKQALLDINNTVRDYPASSTIQELFEKQVEKSPHQVAAVFQEHHLTYSELNARANLLAHMLREKGVRQDFIVGILIDRSHEMVIGMLGILKAGGAYLPIDPETPIKRILNMLAECNSRFLLTSETIVNNYRFRYTMLQDLPSGTAPVHFTGPCRRITDFDNLGFPDRSLVDYEKYNRLLGQAIARNRVMLQASRGCPHNCSYCYRIWPHQQVARSAENILAEILIYYNTGIRKFDIFMLNIAEGKKLFQLIIKNKLNDLELYFPNGFRGDLLSREYIDLMVAAGTVNLALALETASPRLQKLINKNLDLEKFRENAAYICANYPQVILELFTMHGIPTETEAEAKLTLDFVKSLKWVHFPYVNILKIYQNTGMEKLALENGISREAIFESENLAWHQWSRTLPFQKEFTTKYQTGFLNEYLLSKERLLFVLPYQANILTEDELLEKYNSYLPHDIKSMNDLLAAANISPAEAAFAGLGKLNFRDKQEDTRILAGLNEKIKSVFACAPDSPASTSPGETFHVLLLDLSQFFSTRTDILYDVVDVPLGLMYLLTYLKSQFGEKITGKILKSRIDFDNYDRLNQLLEDFKPGIIGIRTLSYYKDFFHETIARIRQWGITVPIVTGGPYATCDWKTVLQDSNIDLAVVGEGETTFCEIVTQVLNNNGKLPADEILKKIPGLAFVPREVPASRRRCREIIMLDQCPGVPVVPGLEPVVDIPAAAKAGNLAYVIFTSGSTGHPKGVAVEHRNAVNVLTWFGEYYQIKKDTHVLQLSNYTFDPSVEQIFGTLLRGGVFYIAAKELITDRHTFRQYILRHQVNIINFVPGALDDLLSHGELLPSLTAIISGGEKLDESLKNRLIQKGYRLFNQYGPTETTIDALASKCSQSKVVLGKPIANVQCFILGENGLLVPTGITGELYIGGAGVARGYLNRPELTAEKFIKNKDHRSYGSYRTYILYKTGDLARWLPGGPPAGGDSGGVIEFLGRMDYQVKIRGHRIELGEIESALLSHTNIKEAVVTVRENSDGNQYLCAYVVSDKDLGLEEVNGFLSHRLRYHMMPQFLVRLPEMPLTTSGKIDRLRLPDPGTVKKSAYIPPRNPVERKMAQIWADVLDIEMEKISIDANFFELGGQSLKATVLMSKIHKEFNAKLTLTEIFKTPVIRELAKIINVDATDKFTAIEPVEKKDYYVSSPAQKRLYILHQLEKNPISYNIPMLIPFNEVLNSRRLEQIFKNLIRRHESFRTSFHLINDEPVQRVHVEVEFKIEYFAPDLPGIKHIVENFVRPFDLSCAPLLRLGLLTTRDDRYILLVDMHHIISDGVSHKVLEADFMALYKGNNALPPLRIQYKDYSEWQNSELKKENLKQQEKYWLKELKGNIPVNIPMDYQRPSTPSFEGGYLSFTIPSEASMALKKIAFEQDATLFMVYLAITNIFLAKISGREDIVIGTPIAGRKHADLEHIVGMFVNTLALRNYPAGEKTFTAFLKEIKARTLEAFDNQDYQFEELVGKLLVSRSPARHPLFDVLYTFDTFSNGPGLPVQDRNEERLEKYLPGTAKFDLKIVGSEEGDNQSFAFEYSTKLFKQETIARFITYYKNITAFAAAYPGGRIMEIDIAGQEERDRLLEKMRTKPDKLFITKISTNDPSYDESVPKAEFDF